jgi:hypothetical protein
MPRDDAGTASLVTPRRILAHDLSFDAPIRY